MIAARNALRRRGLSTLPEHTVFLSHDGAAAQKNLPAGDRPLAYIFGWVGCGERALGKYASIYTSRGIDVLCTYTKPAHVYKPLGTGRGSVTRVVDALASDENAARPLVVQGFSAGAYLYGTLLVELGSRGAAGAAVASRIRGTVFDSPVDLDGVPFGLSRAVVGSEGTMPQRALEATISAYLSPSLPMRKHLQKASDAMHGAHLGAFASPLPAPSLFVYSEADSVTQAGDIKSVTGKWRAAGSDVEEVEYEGTTHVSHLPSDPTRYDQAVERLLRRAGLGGE